MWSQIRRTTELLVSYKLSVRLHFCLRGQILNPRQVLDSLAQTARGNQLEFLVKHKNGLDWPLFAFFLNFCQYFLSSIDFEIGDLSSNRCFGKSEAYYERKSSLLNTFLKIDQ